RTPGPADESWYWAAPLLLDHKNFRTELDRWFKQTNLAKLWSGEQALEDSDAAQGWARHVQIARDLLNGQIELGPPPDDLCKVVARLAIAGFGVTSLRALCRIAPIPPDHKGGGNKTDAAMLAHSFLHLFNSPEAMALLRDRTREIPYWKSVLTYCVD